MRAEQRSVFTTRGTILELLSDDELARVNTAESAAALALGDEYLDLDDPERGSCFVDAATAIRIGHVLPRKAIEERTWRQIVVVANAHRGELARSSPA